MHEREREPPIYRKKENEWKKQKISKGEGKTRRKR